MSLLLRKYHTEQEELPTFNLRNSINWIKEYFCEALTIILF